ncbi:MAG: hypothetical protein IPH84_19300 [Bacteroidales bacterium]|nr:hypothetical protein [Bacteroidales bacterium]
MSDSAVNYYQLKSEFNQFWSDKQPQKGSGYKPVARWFDAQRPFIEPDGSIRSPQLDLEQAQLFMTTNPSQSISGQWTSVGPDMPVLDADNLSGPVAGIGRVSGIAFHPANPNTIYVWVSYNNGLQWENLNTDNISALGVSAIALNPENPDIIYIGTGDRDSQTQEESGYINPLMLAKTGLRCHLEPIPIITLQK